MELYLESALRDLLGVSDSIIKKTRREVLEGVEVNPCQMIVIHGRNHIAYPFEMVRLLIDELCGKKTRGELDGATFDMSGSVCPADVVSALVQGIASGIDPIRSDLVTLKIRQITKNRLIMLASHPDGVDLPPVRLRVKDTEKYLPGMDVPGCRQVEADVWVYAGREPRSRGRW